ncbi:ubiquinol oxidase subunit II [Buchnera aphidicola]|uniref:ubiquinol oxidase subunit II n=1 Tax=Buchnera aphidicola TaxID=9 RepID=UPI0022376C47|nr:ubiquinol oxidase subunit II [Buchnera aphidicola]MCW5197526.1 ubiquinol oxidase subunit II [Buchnera aphidicola (Chaitophorus viminalis)]
MNFDKFKTFLIFFLSFFLIGCREGIISPKGQIALEQKKLIIIAFLIMLIVVVPVILMTIFFSIKYYHKYKNSMYNPNWDHSYIIEFFSWGVPIAIILFLSVLSWKKTHDLDPKKSIYVNNFQPIKIYVLSTNWKWIFIYPQQKIITINELIIPTNIPIKFYITSNTVMNSFFIPSLGSQIYSMPGMITNLNLISNISGLYKGISANYSGKEFSNMKFHVFSISSNNFFYSWTNKIYKKCKLVSSLNDINNIYNIDNINFFSFKDIKFIKKIMNTQ